MVNQLNSKTMTAKINFQLETIKYQASCFVWLKIRKYSPVFKLQLSANTHTCVFTNIGIWVILLLLPFSWLLKLLLHWRSLNSFAYTECRTITFVHATLNFIKDSTNKFFLNDCLKKKKSFDRTDFFVELSFTEIDSFA